MHIHRKAPSGTARAGERGIALMIVMLLAIVLIPFAAEFAYQIDFESRMSQNVTHQVIIDKAIDGQREIVLANLEFDSPNNETDTYDDDWNRDDMLSRSESMGTVQVEVKTTMFDEQAKFNLLLLGQGSDELRLVQKQRLREILTRFRQDTKHDGAGYADELTEDIYGWVSGDGTRGDVPRPKMISGQRLLLLDELHFVSDRIAKERILEDIRDGEEVAPGLHRYVTVYGDGKLNLNTADELVLRAYWKEDPDIAEQIIQRRQGTGEEDDSFLDEEEAAEEGGSGEPFTDVMQVNELESVNTATLNRNKVDLTRDYTVRSNFFGMWITAATEITRRDELIIVERVPSSDPNEGIDGFRFLLHQERSDPLEELAEDDEY